MVIPCGTANYSCNSPIFSLYSWPPKQKDLSLHNIKFIIIITGVGAYAGCTYCTMLGEYSSTLGKMVYFKHQSFLPVMHFDRPTQGTLTIEKSSKIQ